MTRSYNLTGERPKKAGTRKPEYDFSKTEAEQRKLREDAAGKEQEKAKKPPQKRRTHRSRPHYDDDDYRSKQRRQNYDDDGDRPFLRMRLRGGGILLITHVALILATQDPPPPATSQGHQESWPAGGVAFAAGAPRNFSSSAFFAKLERFRLSDDAIARIDDERVLDATPTFVTAFSSDHRDEALRLFETFHARFPSMQLIVYNLDEARGRLQNLHEKFHFLDVRDFAFGAYPATVRALSEYRWKTLIVAEMLAAHDAVWWMDTSVTWNVSAPDPTCMAPPGAKLACEFGPDRKNAYMGCHRYDQSALNLLTMKAARHAFGADSTHKVYTFCGSGIRF